MCDLFAFWRKVRETRISAALSITKKRDELKITLNADLFRSFFNDKVEDHSDVEVERLPFDEEDAA